MVITCPAVGVFVIFRNWAFILDMVIIAVTNKGDCLLTFFAVSVKNEKKALNILGFETVNSRKTYMTFGFLLFSGSLASGSSASGSSVSGFLGVSSFLSFLALLCGCLSLSFLFRPPRINKEKLKQHSNNSCYLN